VFLKLGLALKQSPFLGVPSSQEIDPAFKVVLLEQVKVHQEDVVTATVQRQREARQSLLSIEYEVVGSYVAAAGDAFRLPPRELARPVRMQKQQAAGRVVLNQRRDQQVDVLRPPDEAALELREHILRLSISDRSWSMSQGLVLNLLTNLLGFARRV
jgi:hypothetical protein